MTTIPSKDFGYSEIEPTAGKDTAIVGMSAKLVGLVFIWIAIVTGAVSFVVRPIKIAEAASFQQRILGSFSSYKGFVHSEDVRLKSTATRILMPGIIGAVASATRLSWPFSFSLVRLISIFVAFLAFYLYLRAWFSDTISMLGTLIVAATVPLTFNNFFEYPTDFPELLVFTLGLWCIREKRDWLLCAVIAVGTLNRETTLFLPLILLLSRLDKNTIRVTLLKVAAAGLSWLVPLACLRWWTGIGPMGVYGDSIYHNFHGLAAFFTNFNPYNNYLFYLYLFGPLWLLPFIYWRRQPQFLKGVLLSLPAFLVVYVFLGGFLDEPREIINLYPLLVPAGLFSIFGRNAIGTKSFVEKIQATEHTRELAVGEFGG